MSDLSKDISQDTGLVNEASDTYSKGIDGIANIVRFLNGGELNRRLMVTKEISGRLHEGSVHVQSALQVNVGHADHSYINDQLNYRVDATRPLIVLAEKLNNQIVAQVLELSNKSNRDVVFVTKACDEAAKIFLREHRAKSTKTIALMDLAEDNEQADLAFSNLSTLLRDSDDFKSPLGVTLKTSERVILDSQVAYFVDESLTNSSKKDVDINELVEVHLRSPDEAWIHKYKNDIIDAHSNLQDSIRTGILPEITTTFSLINQDLKDYTGDNADISRGVKIVHDSITTYLEAVQEQKVDESSLSEQNCLNASIETGSFIPHTTATKVVSDIVTICNYLIQNNMAQSK
jgi:hypothetical protein